MFIGGFELQPQFTEWFTSLFDKLDASISSNFSFFNDAIVVVLNLFNYLKDIIVWLSSYSGLTYQTVSIIVGLIAGGIGMIISTYLIKTIVKWWSVLVP